MCIITAMNKITLNEDFSNCHLQSTTIEELSLHTQFNSNFDIMSVTLAKSDQLEFNVEFVLKPELAEADWEAM